MPEPRAQGLSWGCCQWTVMGGGGQGVTNACDIARTPGASFAWIRQRLSLQPQGLSDPAFFLSGSSQPSPEKAEQGRKQVRPHYIWLCRCRIDIPGGKTLNVEIPANLQMGKSFSDD